MTARLGTMSQQVAVYLDMDNIVISRYDQLHGRDSFHDDRANSRNPPALVKHRLSEARLDLGVIMDYASSFGTVVISRAYANWAAPVNASYATDTMRRSVDLIQLFPMAGNKNGADIRLAIDVVDDLSRFTGVTHVVVVAGDSDYVALAQRCKRLGRKVIGVGIAKSVSRYWESACDEFRFYDQLAGFVAGAGTPTMSPEATTQVVTPDAAQPSEPARRDPIPAEVLVLRRQLGLATSMPLGVEGEQLWIRAARLLWRTVDANEPREVLPQDEVVDGLVRSGAEPTAAKRATHQILMTGMPMLVRNTEMTWRSNQELVPLADEQLLRLFRQWNADRARNRNYPDPAPPERLAAALYPAPAPESAIEAFREIAGWGGYEQMRRTLQPVLLPPLVLWDLAQAVCALPYSLPLPSAGSLAAALAGPLADLEREPASVPMTAAYLSLREAGLIADNLRAAAPAGKPELAAVVDAILRSWARRLRAASLLAASEFVCREAFYRLALPDRYQQAQRAWLRELLLDV